MEPDPEAVGEDHSPEAIAIEGAEAYVWTPERPQLDRTVQGRRCVSEAAERDRFRGCLLGLAVGDALGTTLEFKPPGSFEPIDDMVGGGPFRLLPGQWTDDTSMALCLATSLVECGGFDAALLSPGYCPVEGLWERDPLAEKIARVADGSFKDRNPPDIRGTGYVVDALEAALWAFHRSDSFREGALLAVNLGDDADTTGAIYGQIAGAHYGAESIPAAWRKKLAMVEKITSLADNLRDQAALR